MADDSPGVVDLHFPLSGRAVPHDYADALWAAISAALLASPVALPALVTTIASYLGVAATVASAISQVAVKG